MNDRTQVIIMFINDYEYYVVDVDVCENKSQWLDMKYELKYSFG